MTPLKVRRSKPCNDSASEPSISCSYMISPPTTSCYRPPGSSSSRLRSRAHSRPLEPERAEGVTQGLGNGRECARSHPQGHAGGGSRRMSVSVPILADRARQRARQHLSRGATASPQICDRLVSECRLCFFSGAPRYNYCRNSWDIPREHIETEAARGGGPVRCRPSLPRRRGSLDRRGAERRTDPRRLHLHAGGESPPEFWGELKRERLIEQKTRRRPAQISRALVSTGAKTRLKPRITSDPDCQAYRLTPTPLAS